MLNFVEMYHWLAKWPIALLFKLLIDKRITVKNVDDGIYGNGANYSDKYGTLEIAQWAYNSVNSRRDRLFEKLIALTQIHGITFAVVSLVSNSDGVIAIAIIAISLSCNMMSIFLVIFGLSIKNGLDIEYGVLAEKPKKTSLSDAQENEVDIVICNINDRCDFLADMFKLSQGFLLISLILSVVIVVSPLGRADAQKNMVDKSDVSKTSIVFDSAKLQVTTYNPINPLETTKPFSSSSNEIFNDINSKKSQLTAVGARPSRHLIHEPAPGGNSN